MGLPIAKNLLDVGHELTVFDPEGDRSAALQALGATVASDPAAGVREAQIALTLPEDELMMEALAFGAGGLVEALRPGAIHLCMGTIGVPASRRLAIAHAEAGQGYVAAPVFGRAGLAASRQIWIVAGGPEAYLNRCIGVLEALGRGISKVGPRAELAHAVKLGGTLLTATLAEGLSEVLAFGEKAGMPASEYLRILNTALFKSPLLDAMGGLMVRSAFEPPDQSIDAALGEVHAVMEAGEELQAVLPLAELLQHRLELAAAHGLGGLDLTALSQSSRAGAGLEAGVGNASCPVVAEPQARPAALAVESEGETVQLELGKVTHFEVIKNAVWAWTKGKRFRTSWRYLAEVEAEFRHIAFVSIHRHILLQPDAAAASKAQAAEPAPAEPVRGEPIRSEPIRNEPVRSEPVQSEPVQPEPEPEHDPGPVLTSVAAPAEEAEADTLAAPEEALPEEALPEEALPEEGDLELARTSHFEELDGKVWAWSEGRRRPTSWRSLREVELAFSDTILLFIQKHILLNPESVHALVPLFGGRAKVSVSGNIELTVNRSAVARLKELLGI
jgi:3-hydroxyisobutyrate dehydrogenase-like beta-hydroxyacid dehydrogenase